MKLHRYVDHQRLHIVTKDVISLSIFGSRGGGGGAK